MDRTENEQPAQEYRYSQPSRHFSKSSSCLIKTVDEYNAKSLFHLCMDHDKDEIIENDDMQY